MAGLTAQTLRRGLDVAQLLADLAAQARLVAASERLGLLKAAAEFVESVDNAVKLGGRRGDACASAAQENARGDGEHGDDEAGHEKGHPVHALTVTRGSDTAPWRGARPA